MSEEAMKALRARIEGLLLATRQRWCRAGATGNTDMQEV